ncbi:sigma factor [Sphingomonas adhaesiva]|uniref:sigma factor n=1 Tax=Sphingomonas adhaesiva TaxID=28212 RepID=UPI003FA6ADED
MVAFEAARPAMFGIAYRMLGTHADAEDVLQDVFIRWSEADRHSIQNPAAWLTTVCTRRSIDVVRLVARARTDYVGPWLPEPLAGATMEEPQELSFALETAFLLLLQRASPSVRNLPEIDAPEQLLVDFVAFRAVMRETSAHRATEPSQDAFSPYVAVEGRGPVPQDKRRSRIVGE